MEATRRELRDANPLADACIATVGTFDGVHVGHRYLLDEVVQRAREANVLSAVVTFRTQPRSVLSSGKETRIVSTAGQEALLKAAGIDIVASLTFDEALARMTAGEFVSLLKDELAIEGLVMGHDSALGRGREGDFEFLTEAGRQLGFWVRQMPALDSAGFRVSSTAIRAALVEGEVELASRLLGRPFSLDLTGCRAITEDQVMLRVPSCQVLPCDGAYWGRLHAGDEAIGAEILVSSRTVRVLVCGSVPSACSQAELTFLQPVEDRYAALPFVHAYELAAS